jgi:hypothetical protein
MAQYITTSYTSTTGQDGGIFMVHTPVWVTVIRGFQIFFAFLIMILAGLLIHGLAMGAVVFGLVCGLFTLIIVIYALVSEKAPSCRQSYNIWAIISLDAFMTILWLASMGANAALRASFVVDVDASCYDDGSTINAGYCVVSKRGGGLSKRYAVATQTGLAEISAVAGLSALQMLLFIATLVYNGHAFRMHNQQKKSGGISQVEMQYASQVYPQQPVQAQQQPYDPTYYDKQAHVQATQYNAPASQPQGYVAPVSQPQAYDGAYAEQIPYQQQQPYSQAGH